MKCAIASCGKKIKDGDEFMEYYGKPICKKCAKRLGWWKGRFSV